MKDSHKVKPEELLSHRNFLCNLALSLVLDEHLAEDIAQETLLAAIQTPPKFRTYLRSWLASITRNLSHKMLIKESRRKKREQEAAKQEKALSMEEDFERDSIRHSLVKATLGLSEPYRSAILYRFYEGLMPQKIANNLGMPVSTVKSHIQRGLRQLRKDLDTEYGGDRKKWNIALAPLAGISLTSKAGASAGAGLAGLGALVMSTKLKIGIAALFFFGFAITIWQISKEKRENITPPSVSNEQGKSRMKGTESASMASEGNPASSHMGEERSGRIPGQTTRIVLSGIVTDKVTGEPVQAFEFKLKTRERRSTKVVHETVMDEKGRFSFSLIRGGNHSLEIRSSSHIPKYLGDLEIPENNGLTDLKIELDPGLSIRGIVIEDGSRKPVSGALVGAVGLTRLDMILLGHPQHTPCAKTDNEGLFTLQGLGNQKYTIAAVHPDFSEGFTEVMPSMDWVEIRLKPGFRVYGRVYDDDGAPRAGILITLFGKSTPLPRPVLTGRGGKYTSAPGGPGWITVSAAPPSVENPQSFNFTEEIKNAELIDKDVEVNFGPSPQHVTWRGTFFNHTGRPVEGLVFAHYRPFFHGPEFPFINRSVSSNKDGFFEFRKMLVGRYHITLGIPGGSRLSRWNDIIFDHPGIVEKDIHLSSPGATIQGVVVDKDTGMPLRKEGIWLRVERVSPWGICDSTPVDEQGCFCIKNLPPAYYRLSVHGDGIPLGAGFEKEIKLEDGQVVDDIRILVVQGGTFQLRAVGFEPTEQDQLEVCINREGDQSGWRITPFVYRDGTWEMSCTLEPGIWRTDITLKNVSTVTRTFEILPGEIKEVAISRGEFLLFEGYIMVSGSLKGHDGSPIAEAKLYFNGFGVPGLDTRCQSTHCKSDADGKFSLERCKPGRWSVRCLLPNGSWANFDFLIPLNPENPYMLQLVLPPGSIRGSLFDKLTGLPIDENSPRWWIHLMDAKTGHYVCDFSAPHGSCFSFAGISGGMYTMHIFAVGYRDNYTEPFPVSEGENLDLGAIPLEPSGVLIIEVVDEKDKPISPSYVTFPELELPSNSSHALSSNKCLYFNLPFGPVKARVHAKGFQEEEISVCLNPQKHEEVRVVLERQ